MIRNLFLFLMLFGSLSLSAQDFSTMFQNKTHTAEQQPFVDLSQKIWDDMADKNTDSLAKIFDNQCMFVHMGGYWGTSQELATIKGGMIWYKHAEVFGVDVVRVNDENVAVYSTIKLVAEVGGREVTTPFFVTQMFNRQGAEWKLISFVFTTRMAGPGIDRPTDNR